MPPVGFELTISAGERPQTYALNRAATGTDPYQITWLKIKSGPVNFIHAFSYPYKKTHKRVAGAMKLFTIYIR
jgi:hypothetical protein